MVITRGKAHQFAPGIGQQAFVQHGFDGQDFVRRNIGLHRGRPHNADLFLPAQRNQHAAAGGQGGVVGVGERGQGGIEGDVVVNHDGAGVQAAFCIV